MNTAVVNYKDVFQLAKSKGYRIRNKAILMVSDDYWIEWQKIGQLSESDFLELCIIQKWLKDTFEIRFKIEPTINDKLEIFIYTVGWKYLGKYENDESALLHGINEALQLI